MATIAPSKLSTYFDFQKAQAGNRFKGIWRLVPGSRLAYIPATIALAISALAKTCTYLLLRYFADTALAEGKLAGDEMQRTLILIALGFIGLAAVEGGFGFVSGRLAAYTAEGIPRLLPNYPFDHRPPLVFASPYKTPPRHQT